MTKQTTPISVDLERSANLRFQMRLLALYLSESGRAFDKIPTSVLKLLISVICDTNRFIIE